MLCMTITIEYDMIWCNNNGGMPLMTNVLLILYVISDIPTISRILRLWFSYSR